MSFKLTRRARGKIRSLLKAEVFTSVLGETDLTPKAEAAYLLSYKLLASNDKKNKQTNMEGNKTRLKFWLLCASHRMHVPDLLMFHFCLIFYTPWKWDVFNFYKSVFSQKPKISSRTTQFCLHVYTILLNSIELRSPKTLICLFWNCLEQVGSIRQHS